MADTTTQPPDEMLRTLQFRVLDGPRPGIGVSAWLVQKDHDGVSQESLLLDSIRHELERLGITWSATVTRYEIRLSHNGVAPETLRACILAVAKELDLTAVEL